MFIIAIWTHKGGTGKSTIASNISFELSQRGYNVLAVDTDSQADLSSVLYPEYLDEPDINFYEAFVLHSDFKKEGFIFNTHYTNLDVITGSGRCEDLENILSPLREETRNKIFGMCLSQIRTDNYYDFIIIDIDKTAGLLNKAILCESDFILSPIECSIFSIFNNELDDAKIKHLRKNMNREEIQAVFNSDAVKIKKLTIEVPENKIEDFRTMLKQFLKITDNKLNEFRTMMQELENQN